jgi:hypothetical protein
MFIFGDHQIKFFFPFETLHSNYHQTIGVYSFGGLWYGGHQIKLGQEKDECGDDHITIS